MRCGKVEMSHPQETKMKDQLPKSTSVAMEPSLKCFGAGPVKGPLVQRKSKKSTQRERPEKSRLDGEIASTVA